MKKLAFLISLTVLVSCGETTASPKMSATEARMVFMLLQSSGIMTDDAFDICIDRLDHGTAKDRMAAILVAKKYADEYGMNY